MKTQIQSIPIIKGLKRSLGTLFLSLCLAGTQAQTVLVNPATDGGFETGSTLADNGWTPVSNAPNDNWYIGDGLTNGSFNFPSATKCAYISGTALGPTWTYSTASGVGNVAHIYKTITVPAGETEVVLSFKYVMGGTTNTKLMVYVCDSNNTPVTTQPQSNGGQVTAGTWGPGRQVLLFSAATPITAAQGVITFTAPIPPSFLNNCTESRTFKLVFTSFRNSTAANNPPPAVDEISVVSKTPVSSTPTLYTINNTLPTAGTNFSSFTDAINWVNAVANCGLTNPITFNVSAGQTFDENTPYITASGSATQPIIFQKSGAGANPVIRPTGTYGAYQPATSNPNPGTQDYGICLYGADYITFDGIDINSNNASQTLAVEYGYLIRNASTTNGARNNTIKNTTIILDRTAFLFGGTTPGTRGILQTANAIVGGGVTALTPNGSNDNNSYYNITIGNVQQGIVIYGATAIVPDRNTIISTLTPGTFNTIGRPEVDNDIGNGTIATCGINLNYQYNAVVSNNSIQNITTNGTASVDGITIGALTGAFNGSGGFGNEVSNNRISGLKSTSITSTATISGLCIQHDNTGSLGTIGFKIYNNTVSNISSAYTGAANATRAIRGLWLRTAAPSNPTTVQYEIVNNTFVIDGSSAPNLSNTVFENAFAGSVLKLRNNLFYNATGAQSGAAVHSVLGITGATSLIGATGSLSDYNDFYYSDPTGGVLSFNNNITTLGGWQSTFGVDANSISADPKLNSSTILYPLLSSPLVAAAPTLSTPYNRDITGNLRAASVYSTIGAYEQTGDVVSPAISDTLIMGINSTSSRNLPGILRVFDDGGMVANTPGTSPRIYYKKPGDQNVFGANTAGTDGWKWVEASNTSSPFDFTIDYSLLRSAVNIHDTIQYFFVAQDTVSTPNVAALPAAEFSGTSVSSITSAPTTPQMYYIYDVPAVYTSSTATQATAKVSQNTTNAGIIRVAVQTGAGDSAYITSLSFNSTGANDLTNIAAAKVWYTKLDSTFEGSNPANIQFGTTYSTPSGSGALGTVVFNGAQAIPANSTVYFWLSYDIKASAILDDSVDATIVSLTYDETPQIPNVLNPAGSRTIKQPYCNPAVTGGRHLSNVSINTLNNNTGSTIFPTPNYVNYPPLGTATTTLQRGFTYNLSVTQSTASTSSIVMIDYNDNGSFEPDETMIISDIAGAINSVSTLPITIPCDATVSSEIRMRILTWFTSGNIAACVGSTAAGEFQDYTISISDNPTDYMSSSATQFSGTIAPSATNKVMMRLPVIAKGCSAAFLSEMHCNTAETDNAGSNIANAKLYSTGRSNVFTATNLLASVATPSGSFIFTGFSDTLYSNAGDTTFYWITYDLSSGATLNDTIDVRIDSINVANRFVIPANNNPAQYMVVKAANTYLHSEVIHPAATRAARAGQLYTPVLRIRIVGSNSGAPRQLTELNFDPAGGGNDSLNIASARVFYTGNSNTFAYTTQFGNAYTADANMTGTKWNAFTIAGVQDLNFDTNYFWLAYDLNSDATIGDSVDASLVSFNLGGILTPSIATVSGALPIKQNYCFMGPSGNNFSNGQGPSAFEDISSVTFGSMTNTSNCSQTGGVGSILNQYSDYSDIIAPPTVTTGTNVAFSLAGVRNCNQPANNNINATFVILIDWNQNGIFDTLPALNEVAYRATPTTSLTTASGNIFVPCFASPGHTRMRIIYGSASNANNANLIGTICGNASTYIYGETEDYTINVEPNSTPTYAGASFVQPSGMAGQGTADFRVLRVAVKTTGCGAVLNNMNFTLTRNTSPADISSVKLYSTGTSNVFNTNNLLATTSPSGNDIQFSGLNALLNNASLADSNYLWLTFDLSPTATALDTVDARLDSLYVLGDWRNTTSNGNPANYFIIPARMTYSDMVITHPNLSSVAQGAIYSQILRVLVKGTNTGPIPITGLSFNVTGGQNIDSARVFYTGASSTFAATTQFGSAYSAAPGTWGSFTISDNITTSNTDNYFWLVFDLKTTATMGDSVDAELTGVTFDGNLEVPSGSNGAPEGTIKIRGEYCTTSAPGTNNNYYRIPTTIIGGVTNAQVTGGNPSPAGAPPFYSDFSALTPRNVSKGPNNISVSTADFGAAVGGYTYLYIDLDQNGDFSGPDEFITSAVTPSPGGATTATAFTYNIPCSAKTGLTRMRLMASKSATAPSLCGASTFQGETEDYTINIQDAPLAFSSSSVTQTSGNAASGGNNQVIMRIKVKVDGCGTPLLTDMYFNTSISSNPAADIAAAKLYTTGTNPIFSSPSTSTLLGTVNNPAGQFSFNISDLLTSFDTTNYWLTYDVQGSAINGDTLDVRLDSIMVMDTIQIPNPNDPPAFRTVLAPMSVLDLTASNPSASTDRIGQGTNNHKAMRIRVIASSSGAAAPVTSLSFNTTGGSNDIHNLANAKVYYTLTDSFATTNQFGTTYTAGSNISGVDWLPFTISGYQELAPDTSYFWLTFDVKSDAPLGDSIDAEVSAVVIAGTTHSVNNPAPAGNVIVRSQYCSPTSSALYCIDSAYVGSMVNATVGTCSPYFDFSDTLSATAYAGSTLPIHLVFAAPTRASAFIDLNRNGIFEPSEEYVLSSTFVPSVSTTVTIPTTALLGDTRIRLRTFYGGTSGGTDRSCSFWNQSGAHDYTLTILPALPQSTYTWNNSGTSDFNLASNWTPVRNAASPSDELVFDSDSVLNITNVFPQTVASLTVTQGTILNMNAPGSATLKVTGTLSLGDNAKINGNANITVEIGESPGTPGTLTAGMNCGINAPVKRWVGLTNYNSSILFPITQAKGTRSLTINYMSPPVYGSITASFVPSKALGDFGFPLYESSIGAMVNVTCSEGYWNLVAADGLSGGVYDATFSMDSIAFLPNPYSVTVINRPDAFSPWSLDGNQSDLTFQDQTTSISRTGMQKLEQFTVAADSTQNPLPVTLLSFTAKTGKSGALVQWTTSSEVNNNGFDLERSVDGRSFEKVSFIKGNGTSMVAHSYSYNDVNAFGDAGSNTLYYRLQQIDNNGRTSYSNVVRVSREAQSLASASVNPNPFSQSFALNLNANEQSTVNILITDYQGRVITSKQVNILSGANAIEIDELATSRAGVYFVKIISSDDSQVIKVVKH